MSKKNTVKRGVATVLGVALLVGGSGCTFLQSDVDKDYKQTVATVNIAKSEGKDELIKAHANDLDKLITNGYLNDEIYKIDLYSAFMTTGYNYVQSYGYSYEDTFKLLMDSLVNTKLVAQYAVAYYLGENETLTVADCESYVAEKLKSNKNKDAEDALKQVYTIQYFLTEKDTELDDYNYAVYQFKKSINDALDSSEQTYIVSDEEHDHGEARIKPTNATVEKEEYYPKKDNGELDYDVYTGRNPLDSCGDYEKVEGSTVTTRQKAYNAFLANLQASNLIQKGEDTSKFTEISYYYEQLLSTLTQALLGKYGDDLTEEAIEVVGEKAIADKYQSIYNSQERKYKGSNTDFETALGSISDDSFILYGKKGFGFVYNILLPFSASQQQAYSAAKNKNLSQDELFVARRDILKGVQAKDLRDTWFDKHEHATSAYEVTEGYFNEGVYEANKGEKTYLFFKDNGKDGKYEALTQYAGQYPYNGKVTIDEDGEYEFEANEMDIDGFIEEMNAYINATVGKEVAKGEKVETYNATKYTTNGVVDYKNFVYYEGKVDLENKSAKDFFNPEADQYKALSAVNELMFAYSTDTGCLNTYMGYAVNPYKTSFVSEFEYAAQMVVEKGVGSYAVCATDYGWHIVYTSFVYDMEDGNVYGGYNAEEKDVEGTFSNLFFESLKSTIASDYMTNKQNNILNACNNDKSVKLYESRYKDFFELDNN